ncbi:MAG: hypothetical protein K2O56_04070, partial [Muribaculaceae bacterium]|nr:hypothetical protein [Muribaculaceae bacterium]
ASYYQTAKALSSEYERLLLEDTEQAKKEGKEEWGESAEEIGNWISAFRKYRKFHDRQIEEVDIVKKSRSAMIEASRETARHLLLESHFSIWGISTGLTEDTMDSYVSYIKRVNRDLFCKTGYDFLHDFLPTYVKTKNKAKINEMFAAMNKILDERIDSYNETEMSREAFKNCRTALNRYARFIEAIINRK